jgi:hypothetical protein
MNPIHSLGKSSALAGSRRRGFSSPGGGDLFCETPEYDQRRDTWLDNADFS